MLVCKHLIIPLFGCFPCIKQETSRMNKCTLRSKCHRYIKKNMVYRIRTIPLTFIHHLIRRVAYNSVYRRTFCDIALDTKNK